MFNPPVTPNLNCAKEGSANKRKSPNIINRIIFIVKLFRQSLGFKVKSKFEGHTDGRWKKEDVIPTAFVESSHHKIGVNLNLWGLFYFAEVGGGDEGGAEGAKAGELEKEALPEDLLGG